MTCAGRLFERLQHRIEGRSREHVHFVDDVDLEAARRRRVQRIFQQLAHVVDLGIGGGVELDRSTKRPPSISQQAPHFPQGVDGDPSLAVKRLRDDAGERRFSDAARTGEEIGVVQPLLVERIGERPHHVLLPHELAKAPGAPFTG